MAYRAIIRLEDKKQNVIHYEEATKMFSSIEELKKYLKEKKFIDVTKAKKLYVDTKSGETKQVGWIRDTWEYYTDNGKRFPASYWVEVQEIRNPNLDK